MVRIKWFSFKISGRDVPLKGLFGSRYLIFVNIAFLLFSSTFVIQYFYMWKTTFPRDKVAIGTITNITIAKTKYKMYNIEFSTAFNTMAYLYEKVALESSLKKGDTISVIYNLRQPEKAKINKPDADLVEKNAFYFWLTRFFIPLAVILLLQFIKAGWRLPPAPPDGNNS